METYISLLRGINVSGHKIIKMKGLAKMFESLGFEKVKTYAQSGNVTFQHRLETSVNLEKIIQNRIQSDFGFNVPVRVLTAEKLKNIAENNPLVNDPSKEISFLHVTFLAASPKNINFTALQNKTADNEEIIITDEAVYLYCPNGYGKTKLNNTFLEKRLGINATTRNWKTTEVLLKMVKNNY